MPRAEPGTRSGLRSRPNCRTRLDLNRERKQWPYASIALTAQQAPGLTLFSCLVTSMVLQLRIEGQSEFRNLLMAYRPSLVVAGTGSQLPGPGTESWNLLDLSSILGLRLTFTPSSISLGLQAPGPGPFWLRLWSLGPPFIFYLPTPNEKPRFLVSKSLGMLQRQGEGERELRSVLMIEGRAEQPKEQVRGDLVEGSGQQPWRQGEGTGGRKRSGPLNETAALEGEELRA